MPELIYTPEAFEKMYKLMGNVELAYYSLAAEKLGISYRPLLKYFVSEYTRGDKVWRIFKSLTPINNSVAVVLATYKGTTNQLLSASGLSIPRQAKVGTVEEIREFIETIGTDKIVLKPQRGIGGAGVSVLPKTDEELKNALKNAKNRSVSDEDSIKILAEEYIEGRDYRLLVLDNRVIAALYRVPAYVIGDGKSNIIELINRKNLDKESKKQSPIPIDKETEKALQKQNMTLESVPEDGKHIRVRQNCNMCQGGSTQDCTDEVNPVYTEAAVHATKVLGLKLSGVDLITPDISDGTVKYAINEVNHNPMVELHYMVEKGKNIDVAALIQQYILENIT